MIDLHDAKSLVDDVLREFITICPYCQCFLEDSHTDEEVLDWLRKHPLVKEKEYTGSGSLSS